MQNFTVADLVQTTLASLAFGLFLLPTGYLFGLTSNLFGMRGRSGAEKILFAVAFSVATTPVLAVLLTRVFSYPVTLAFFLLLALISVFTLVRQLPQAASFFSNIQRSTWIFLGLTLTWFLVMQFSLADLQIGRHLYVNYVIYDHSVRVPFVEAAARSGVPPHNPFYGLGKVPVLRYFYYWYVVCALPVRLFGLPAKACFDASIFWSGLGVASLIPLYLKYFFGEREALRTKSLIGIALLSVTGLDLLAYIVWAGHYRLLIPDMEWWDNNQITSWLGSLLWVPHHVASMTACMAGLLALSTIEEDQRFGQTVWAVILAGLAFASAAGLSVYVVFSFAIFLLAWTLLTLAERRLRAFVAYLVAGALSLLLSVPYLLDLLSKAAPGASGGRVALSTGGDRFAFIAIRDFRPGMEMLSALGIHSHWLLELSNLPMLVIVYFIEFGLFALIVPLAWRRWRQARESSGAVSRQQRMAWLLVVICVLVLSLVKSDTSGSNDLGWRGMLVVQFILLLWAAPVLYEVFSRPAEEGAAGKPSWLNARWLKISLICTLVLGFAGSALQLTLLRIYAPLLDSGRLTVNDRTLGSPGFGRRTFWLRDGFTRVHDLTPANAAVQYNPVRDEVLITHLYSTRQAVVGDAFCGSAFGGDGDHCRDKFPLVSAIFNAPELVRGWDVDRFCDDFQISVLAATNADPVWHDPDSWVWSRPAVVSNPGMRATACGTTRPLAATR